MEVSAKSVRRAALVAFVIFIAGVAGFSIQCALPTQNVADAHGAIGSVVGLVTLLLALVLGLLIWTSYSVFTTQQSEAQTLGSMVLQLDMTLEKYGAEAISGRRRLRAEVLQARERFWGGGASPTFSVSYEQSRAELHEIDMFFASLQPETDARRQLLTKAQDLWTSIAQTRLLMSRQLGNPVPALLMTTVVCWSAVLFVGFGLLANFSVLAVCAEAVGAICVASAIFLILEFSEPYSGTFTVESSGIDLVVAALRDRDQSMRSPAPNPA